MLRFYLSIIFTFWCGFAQSQQYAPVEQYLIDSLDLNSISEKDKILIDSALNLYRDCNGDICRIGAVSIIVQESWDINVWPRYNRWIHDFAQFKLKDQSLDSATLQNLRISYAGALNNIGYLFNATGQTDSALHYYDRCLEIQKEIDDKTGMSGTLINTGYIFLNQGQINKALDYYYESLRIEEDLGNSTGIATALNGIGFIQYKQGESEQAFANYSRSLTIRRELKDDYGTATCLNNIGLIFKDNQEWDKALEYFSQCYDLQKKISDNAGIAISLANMGFVYRSLGQLNMALSNYSEGLNIMTMLEDKQGISGVLNSMASLYLQQGDLYNAKTNATRSLALAEELDYPSLIRDASETLAGIAERENNWKEALKHYQRHVQMRDSVFNEETLTGSIREQFRYQYEKQALADSISNANAQRLQEAENDRLTALAAKRRQQTYFLIIGILLSIVSSILIFNRMKTVFRQKRIIQEQNQELELQKKDLSKFAHTVSHDLKTPINGIIGMMNLLEYEHTNLEPKLKEKLDLVKDSATRSAELISGILAYSEASREDLKVEEVDLSRLVNEVIGEIPNPGKVNIEVPYQLPTVQCNRYQIWQVFSNLISNGVKYNDKSQGEGRIEVSHRLEKGLHEFRIKDNGPGIPPSAQKKVFNLFEKVHNSTDIDSSGVGLSIVQKLVTQNGGTIKLESQEHKGTSFIFTWKG